MAKRRPERVLVMKHTSAEDIPLEPVNRVQIIRLSADETGSHETHASVAIRCRMGALPFEQASFDLVVLHQLVSDGSEQFLRSALRVLAAGGDLVISGLNSAGLRYRMGNRVDKFPGLKLNRVCKYLKSQSFKIEHCLRLGLAGMPRPLREDSWHGLALPFADRVVLHGHHQSNITNASILRFKQSQRARAASAALDGISSRKAAS